ncbi:response regulator transcription factor [Streptomonospora wellingtoniae]|uniref:Response regulator transcription factor n=1 Tax=Streptomonospora wellingtoniae TaxID=3075544 RepID=A0ABU2KPS8_9ACTN|nr:response regulator transcription factor [Streptomonospora sp. DSM 45055]MDT0301285.1 response regulator transcription factor [Streptomonospora sp. DSM 45055]
MTDAPSPARGDRTGRGPYRVVVADDHDLIRSGFAMLIDSAEDLAAVGEAGTGRDAVAAVEGEHPDVVLMDVRMPDVDGIEATRRICGDPRTSGTRVLILTTYDSDEHVFGALRAGASGFLLKTARPPELLAAIRVVARGEALLAPSVTRRLVATFAALPGTAAAALAGECPAGLTEREREVLVLVARGLSNDEIAAHLRVGAATVKTHISRLLAKTGSRDRAQLVIAAYEAGLVTPRLGAGGDARGIRPQGERRPPPTG